MTTKMFSNKVVEVIIIRDEKDGKNNQSMKF